MLRIQSHELTLEHTHAMRVINLGKSAQRHSGPRFAEAAEQLREAGVARITRDGVDRFYTFTPEGRALFAALGDTRIGGGL